MIHASPFQAMCHDILEVIGGLHSESHSPVSDFKLYEALNNKYEDARVGKALNSLQSSGDLEVKNLGDKQFAFVPINYTPPDPIIFENPQDWYHDSDLPERRFLDDRKLIPQVGVTLLFADGGMGKSLLALQLAVGVAHTGDWIGDVVTNGSVVYISAEEPRDEIHRRLHEITTSFNSDLDGLYNLSVLYWAGVDSVLVESTQAGHIEPTKKFIKLRESLIKRNQSLIKPKLNLIVIDSLIDVYGVSIIDPVQAKHAMRVFHGLSMELDCPVLILSHPSKSGMSAGDGDGGTRAWNNAARSRLYLEREYLTEDRDKYEPNPDVRLLSSKKANYSKAESVLRIEWINHAFHLRDKSSEVESKNITDEHADEVFLRLVKMHYDQKQTLSASPNAHSNYAPKVMARHRLRDGCKQREFRNAMQRCLDDKMVLCQTWGPKARRQKTLVLKEDYKEDQAPW